MSQVALNVDFYTYIVDNIQDFLCKLGMKPSMHLVEISIFSLNHVIVRPTKIIKDLCKAKPVHGSHLCTGFAEVLNENW